MAIERIQNSKTGHYYRIQQKNTNALRKGQILGRWHKD